MKGIEQGDKDKDEKVSVVIRISVMLLSPSFAG